MEIVGLRNAHAFAAWAARQFARRRGVQRFMENGRLTFDELVHEATVGLWLASQMQCPEGKDLLGHYAGRARARMERFVRDQFGLWAGTPEREFQIPQSEDGDDMEFSVQSREEEQLLGGNLLEIARGVILANSRADQGQKDWRVLRLFLMSYTPSEIAKACSWLKDGESSRAAVARIVTDLRRVFGGDLTSSIMTHPSGMGNFSGRSATCGRANAKEYYTTYYSRNAERIKKRQREYIRDKRAALKSAKAAREQFEDLFEK